MLELYTMNEILTIQSLRYHIFFCCMVLILPAIGIYFYMGGIAGSLLLTGIGCGLFLISVYIGRWLCVTSYLTNRYGQLALHGVACLVLTLMAWWTIVRLLFAPHASLVELSVFTAPFFIVGIGMGVLGKSARVRVQQEVGEARLAAEQREGELNLLQYQLSPHFLFNTLNNMYSLSLMRPAETPGLLLKLSELLRYSLYDTKLPFVPLREELAYIRNYLDFEKLRSGDRVALNETIAVPEDPRIKIAPMVLIVFIENAFKHAKNTWNERIAIEIDLRVEGKHIRLSVKNSHAMAVPEQGAVHTSSGLGLANTVKRLKLLYGDGYHLTRGEDARWYWVELQLQIKH